MLKQFCRRGTKYKSRYYRYFRSEKGMVAITKTKKKTKAAILLENLKDNKVVDNQETERSSKYSENRNITVKSVSAPISDTSISETNYWPPEELDNLFPILPCIQSNGTLDVDSFKEEMEKYTGGYRGRFLLRYLLHRDIYTNSRRCKKRYRKKIVHLLMSGYALFNITRRKKTLTLSKTLTFYVFQNDYYPISR